VNVSFIHRGGPEMASYRYRASIPAKILGASLNDLKADTVVFAKPAVGDDHWALFARNEGRTVIVDFCDDHFDQQLYQRMLQYADYVTCPTEAMKARIAHPDVTVILDPYEFDEEAPHCNGNKVLWFGHGTNFPTLLPLLPQIFAPLTVVSNIPLAMPWSLETMVEQFALNDIVILPATADYKSPNRAVEAIRQGCFVVAEPHPALNDFPGIWIGDIPKGIEWASQNPLQANAWTRRAQKWVKERYSPRTLADAWKRCWTGRNLPQPRQRQHPLASVDQR
jgi:hypothetical protein